MIKGVQYSHYCGTELLELVSSIKLMMELMDEDKREAKEWGVYALKNVSNLRDKISKLDILNDMKY